MNIKEIKEMIALMNENNLLELEIEKDDMKIRLKKSSGTQFEVVSSASSGAPVREIIETRKQDVATPQGSVDNVKSSGSVAEIKSPMVGTFYRAPSPESAPFVEVGQTIAKGQVICIIEAMKLMNEIKSDHSGKIVEILVNNAEPVEYGQIILRLEPSA